MLKQFEIYCCTIIYIFFFFNDTATTEIYTLSLHDALPISPSSGSPGAAARTVPPAAARTAAPAAVRSEEHTSELQSRQYLVCRLLLEKKKSEAHITGARRCGPEGVGDG